MGHKLDLIFILLRTTSAIVEICGIDHFYAERLIFQLASLKICNNAPLLVMRYR